jgi:hypothetical protein
MLRLWLSLLFCALLIIGADRDPADSAKGFKNGRYWMQLDRGGKISYLYGIRDALQMESQTYHSYLSESLPTFGDLRSALDRFYEDAANLSLPILLSLKLVSARAEGMPPDRWEELVARHRKFEADDLRKLK